MNIETQIRKLARSSYWLCLYRSSKEISSISLFDNCNHISGIQSMFLFWLKAYDSIYENMSNKDFDFLDEEYIKDDIRVDAFLYWRFRKYESELKKHREGEDARKLLKGSKSGKQTVCNVDLRSS